MHPRTEERCAHTYIIKPYSYIRHICVKHICLVSLTLSFVVCSTLQIPWSSELQVRSIHKSVLSVWVPKVPQLYLAHCYTLCTNRYMLYRSRRAGRSARRRARPRVNAVINARPQCCSSVRCYCSAGVWRVNAHSACTTPPRWWRSWTTWTPHSNGPSAATPARLTPWPSTPI